MPIVSSCPTWLRALRAYLPYEPLCLCAFDSYVVFVFFLRALLALTFLRTLLIAFIFLRVFTFPSVSNFLRALCAFTFL